jgi:hypothetical protein
VTFSMIVCLLCPADTWWILITSRGQTVVSGEITFMTSGVDSDCRILMGVVIFNSLVVWAPHFHDNFPEDNNYIACSASNFHTLRLRSHQTSRVIRVILCESDCFIPVHIERIKKSQICQYPARFQAIWTLVL